LGNKAPALKRKAFTLTEVLIGLALASIVLGVVLQAATRDVISVARTPDRYQALLRASQVLEYRMEEDHQGDDPRGSAGEKFPYDISNRPVVTDPRVEQVEVAVGAGAGLREAVSAYRLRIRRQAKAADASPSPSPSPGASTSPDSSGSSNNGSTSPAIDNGKSQ
jgi:prepilin-type N-terminal cleavage/methylation domain-containing protein